jgi:hypothetical protein
VTTTASDDTFGHRTQNRAAACGEAAIGVLRVVLRCRVSSPFSVSLSVYPSPFCLSRFFLPFSLLPVCGLLVSLLLVCFLLVCLLLVCLLLHVVLSACTLKPYGAERGPLVPSSSSAASFCLPYLAGFVLQPLRLYLNYSPTGLNTASARSCAHRPCFPLPMASVPLPERMARSRDTVAAVGEQAPTGRQS